jgi:hypothetical protein
VAKVEEDIPGADTHDDCYADSDYNSRRKSLILLFSFGRKKSEKASDLAIQRGEASASSVDLKRQAEVGDENTLMLDPRRPRDYLVIYIHFLQRVVKRMSSKGFQVLFKPQTYSEISYAVLLDPNGIEVRLYELTNDQYWISQPHPTRKVRCRGGCVRPVAKFLLVFYVLLVALFKIEY